jgi:hypothetical protein
MVSYFCIQYYYTILFYKICLTNHLITPEPQTLLRVDGSPIEEVLRKMWAQLNVIVTDNDHNFYEYGGSSLVAMQFMYPL